MSKILLLIIIIGILIIGILLMVYQKLSKEEVPSLSEPGQISMSEEILAGKKIVMVIAFRDFRDEEYFIPKQILQDAGAEITTVSSSLGKAIGADGGEANVDELIENLQAGDYEAVLFIGGPGAQKLIDDEVYHRVARQTIEEGKVLAAICIAPAILAKAGVLEGKKATVWSSVLDKSALKILQKNGAQYQSEPVVVDGKIVTANGPAAAKDFAQAIIEILK